MALVLEVGEAWVASTVLCSLRIGSTLMLTPILNGYGVPVRIRVLFVIALSAALVSILPLTSVFQLSTAGNFIGAAICELALGALLGFAVICAFAVFSFAGGLLDQQLGFSLATVFDPTTRRNSPLIASMLGICAVVMFFTLEAHHALVRGLAFSLEQIPLGSGFEGIAPAAVARQFGLIFNLGLLFAAPVMFCIFLIEIGMAVLSRTLPQMNIFVISMPIKIAAGLTLLMLLLPRATPLFNHVFASTFTFWEGVL